MKILVRNTDNVVIYAQDDLNLNESMAYGEHWLDSNYNTSNAMIVDAQVPVIFAGGLYSYVDGAFNVLNQTLHDELTAQANKVQVPQTITRFQALAALHNAGLLTQVQAAVTASTDPMVSLAWNNAQAFNRNSSMLESLATALNITQTQLDNLFIAGAGINA
jgi:hypothetical protein